MKILLACAAIFIVSFFGVSAEVCCPEKEVGGKSYMLTDQDQEETEKFNCISGCIYSLVGGGGNSRFCFRSGSLEVVCLGDKEGSDGTFYSTPLPFFRFNSGGDDKPTRIGGLDKTILKHKDGYGVELKACASATFGVTAIIKIELDITAVTSTIIRENAQELQQYLKPEYQAKFKRENENVAYGVNFAWDWLGISASGQYDNSTSVKEFYVEGSKGLEEARKQFTQSIYISINSKTKIKGEAAIPGTSLASVEFCLFFRIQKIEFSDNESMTVVIDDPNQAKTARKDGKEVPHNGEIGFDATTF